jgi:hypothetical protein
MMAANAANDGSGRCQPKFASIHVSFTGIRVKKKYP